MSKITKEQADFILSKINSFRQLPFNHGLIGPFESHLITTAIEECMEKTFPNFEMYVSDYSGGKVLGKLFITKIQNRIEIQDMADRKKISLSKNEFLKMTEGCQKICEWIKSEKDSKC